MHRVFPDRFSGLVSTRRGAKSKHDAACVYAA